MTTTSAPYDTGVLLDPTHLSEVLKSFPKHRSAMAPRLQEYLLVERLEGLHGEQLLDIAGVCCWLADNEAPLWWSGRPGYLTKGLGRSANFAAAFDELRKRQLLHFHHLSTGGVLISATPKLLYALDILGNDG